MNTRVIIIISTIISAFAQIFAQNYDYINLGIISRNTDKQNAILPRGSDLYDEVNTLNDLPRKARVKRTTRSIPEGVEEIGSYAFYNCKQLTAKVVMPTTLKRIDTGAYFSSKITECNFPEGLVEIGDGAFYGTRIKEAIMPNTCQSFPGGDHFGLCYELEKVRIPEGPKLIPQGFVDDYINLTEFIMPNSIEEIGNGAFWEAAH